MAKQSEGPNARELQISRREDRAQRILDAASALILRWGYDKVTLEDVSRQAGVAKGTLYLHWSSREALFKALLQREREVLTKEITQRIRAHPAEGTLSSLLKHSALALMKHPLLKAVLLRDWEMLGKWAQREQSGTAYAEALTGFTTCLAMLRDQGLVRADLSLRAQVYLVSSLFAGCFLMESLISDEFTLSDEELADVLAETLHCTLEIGSDVPSDAFQIATHAFLHSLNQTMTIRQEEL